MNTENHAEVKQVIKWFLLISRAAFIANIFFLLYIFFTVASVRVPQIITGIILSIGFALSPLLNVGVFFSLIYLLLKKYTKPAAPWLILVNLFFLIFQIFYFIFT